MVNYTARAVNTYEAKLFILHFVTGRHIKINSVQYSPPWEAVCPRLDEVLGFYVTWRFNTVFTNARKMSLSWPTWIQSTLSHAFSSRFTSILSSHLKLGLPSGLFLWGFSTKTLFAFLFAPMLVTCSAHLILLYLMKTHQKVFKVIVITRKVISSIWTACEVGIIKRIKLKFVL